MMIHGRIRYRCSVRFPYDTHAGKKPRTRWRIACIFPCRTGRIQPAARTKAISGIAENVGDDDVSESTTIKDAAHRIVEQLPDDASWEDLIYRLYVRQSIEAGVRDGDAGRVESVAEVRKSFGLPE
jgi:hypothetical protein